ncbi:Lar family restriction alleviation protein [Pseudomonas guariconensis]|uniref:Lar family restriction alleviation protein n=1 Tax=Pseudomonas guariconensis TaxID=1288410 RepID=UPI00384CB61C
MSTENRSSNTEMVSDMLPCPFCDQQDFLIERLDSDASVVICQGLTGPHEACLARGPVGVAQDEGEEQPGRDKAVKLWNARAKQHQGEPVVWSAVKPVSPGAYWIRGNGLDQEALVQVVNDGELRCNLHQRTTEADFGWGYAVSDLSPEFEWLGPLHPHSDPGEVERLRAKMSELLDAFAESQVEVIRRGNMLAEQDALLREAHEELVCRDSPVAQRIIAALSASAEPSAPVERDERAAFELIIGQKWPGIRMLRINRPGAPADGEYELPGLEGAWQGWQARAALARKPS